MEKINRDNFYNYFQMEDDKPETAVQKFNPQKAIEEIADKIDEIIDKLNN